MAQHGTVCILPEWVFDMGFRAKKITKKLLKAAKSLNNGGKNPEGFFFVCVDEQQSGCYDMLFVIVVFELSIKKYDEMTDYDHCAPLS